MKSSGAVIVGWGAIGLMLGAAIGLLQAGMREAPAKRRVVLGENSPVVQAKVQAGKAAPADASGKVPETGGSQLHFLEKLARASRADLEVLTRETTEGGDWVALHALWDRWVEVDAEGGFALLTSGAYPARPPQQPYIWNYLGRWSLRDPDAAVTSMLTLKQREINVACSRMSHALAAERPADFFRLLPQLSKGHDADYCLAAAAYHLAAKDPAAVVKLLEGWPVSGDKKRDGDSSSAERSRMLAGLALGWAATDPNAALAWVRGQPDSKDRGAGLENIARCIARDQPDLAASLLTEVHGAPPQDGPGANQVLVNALKNIARDWGAADPDAAMNWLTQRFGEAGKSVARELAAENIPQEAGAAVDYLVRNFALLQQSGKMGTLPVNKWSAEEARAGLDRAAEIKDPQQRQTVETLFLNSLARRAPAEAIGAAQQRMSSPGARDSILQIAMTYWANEDITAASGWLQSQSPGTDRDSAIKGLLSVAVKTEPDSALQWAATLSTPNQRTSQIALLFQRLSPRGSEDVREILTGMSLPEEEISTILSKLKPAPAPAPAPQPGGPK